MSTIYTVTATLSYALLNPDCTKTSRDELMRMAARYIDELEKANYDLVGEIGQLRARLPENDPGAAPDPFIDAAERAALGLK